MKRFLQIMFATSAVLFVFIWANAFAGNRRYVVPARSSRYHHPSCRFARKFRSGDMASFRSAKDALGAGYVPCKVCRPPDH